LKTHRFVIEDRRPAEHMKRRMQWISYGFIQWKWMATIDGWEKTIPFGAIESCRIWQYACNANKLRQRTRR
jgi:hypothetical protein